MKDKNRNYILPPEHSNQMLENIMMDLNLNYEKELTFSYRFLVFWKYTLKKIFVLLLILLLTVLFIPHTIIPVGITNISIPEDAEGGFIRVSFQVTSQLLTRAVNATLNDHILPVVQEDHHYYVDVNENGCLLLETVSVTGIHSSHQIAIEGLDNQAPSVIRHNREGGNVVIYLTDDNGTGIDYDSIYGYVPDSSLQIMPVFYDEKRNCVAFPYPQTHIYINIPDKGGNRLTISLEPTES